MPLLGGNLCLNREHELACVGQEVRATYARSVILGGTRFALIERAHEFSLVPWKPSIERALGKQLSGIVREGGISWTIG